MSLSFTQPSHLKVMTVSIKNRIYSIYDNWSTIVLWIFFWMKNKCFRMVTKMILKHLSKKNPKSFFSTHYK